VARRLFNKIVQPARDNCRHARLTPLVIASLLSLPSVPLMAAERAGDCTEIDLRFETLNAPLTDAEIAELRARRHAESLNAFERCVTNAGRGAGNGGGQGNGAQGQGNGGVAAAGITGTNPTPVEAEPPTEIPQNEVASEPSEQQQSNGRAPQDIPPADNDSVLAAQIRQAAETETDPDRQAKLWNEYRKIKGLPTKDS